MKALIRGTLLFVLLVGTAGRAAAGDLLGRSYTKDDLSEEIRSALEETSVAMILIDDGENETVSGWVVRSANNDLSDAHKDMPNAKARKLIRKAEEKIERGKTKAALKAGRCARKEIKRLGDYMDAAGAEAALSRAIEELERGETGGARTSLEEASRSLRITPVEDPLENGEKLLKEAKADLGEDRLAEALEKIADAQEALRLAYRRSRLLQVELSLRYAKKMAEEGHRSRVCWTLKRAKRKLDKVERLTPAHDRPSIDELEEKIARAKGALKEKDPDAAMRIEDARALAGDLLRR